VPDRTDNHGGVSMMIPFSHTRTPRRPMIQCMTFAPAAHRLPPHSSIISRFYSSLHSSTFQHTSRLPRFQLSSRHAGAAISILSRAAAAHPKAQLRAVVSKGA
jgi:hypothetical protein